MKIRPYYALGLTLLLVSLSACSVMRPIVVPEERTVEPVPAVPAVPAAPAAPAVPAVPAVQQQANPVEDKSAIIINRVNLLLEQQSYLPALSIIRHEVKNGLSESSFEGGYLQALLGAFQQAEDLRAEGIYDVAGRNFKATLDGFPRDSELAGKVPFSPEIITTKIEDCADQLMENGLLAYRAGDLDTAIELWEKILSFQPQHEPSIKAIHTASLQLTNLKSLNQSQ